MSIYSLINEIERGELVLPAIQRDFVWNEKQIETLLDSVFRGYPVGIVLLWDTYQPIQIRNFEKAHNPKQVYEFFENKKGKRLKLVLDGQQRLSSLFVALRGSFNGQKLYFDVMSGGESDNHADLKYRFMFARENEIKERNSAAEMKKNDGDVSSAVKIEYWQLLSDLVGKSPKDMMSIRNIISNKLKLEDEEKLSLETNIATASYALTGDSEILKTQIIDADLTPDDERRKSAFDILEIFVRINTQGTTLKRSDLIVSMLRLYWQDSSSVLPRFIKEINEGNSFDIDNDFVIRCMFSTAGIGTRLDFDLLRRKSNVEAIKNTYKDCFNAIRICIDFVKTDCGIDSSKLIGGISTLVPFVYYFYKTKTQNFDIMSRQAARKSLLLFSFSKVLSQHVDSRSGSFIRDYLAPGNKLQQFPVESVLRYINWHTAIETADSYLFGNNVDLALSLIQGKSGSKVKHFSSQSEIDHIFPKSELARNHDSADINRLGNYWILPLNINRNKSAKHPNVFFGDVEQSALDAAFIDKEKLDYRMYKSFVRDREEKITNKLIEMTGISNEIFRSALREAGEIDA